jgi:hypothetical protein
VGRLAVSRSSPTTFDILTGRSQLRSLVAFVSVQSVGECSYSLGGGTVQINTRVMVTKVMPAVVAVLKKRFPNLTAEDSVMLAGEICDCILKVEPEEPIAVAPAPDVQGGLL